LTWSTGDYARLGDVIPITAKLPCAGADMCGEHEVLDVACSGGNAALVAARRFRDVTATDDVPASPEEGRKRAVAEGLAPPSKRLPPTTPAGLPFPLSPDSGGAAVGAPPARLPHCAVRQN